MAEGLLIQVGADVNGAIAGLQRIGLSLNAAEKRFAELIETTGDFDAALVQLAREGGVSVNFLEKEMKDFKDAFANATDPEQAKKFGDALQVLKIRQQELINTGLSVANSQHKVTESHAGGVVATQRLSASLLGLNKIFEVLPEELQHATHGFDQIIQSFERVTHGTESTGEKIQKFAGVLGEVGLGIAISVAVGLLVEFTKELFNNQEALDKATEEGLRFAEAIKKIDENIKSSKENIKFISQLSDINIDINFGKGKEADLLKVRGGLEDLRQEAFALEEGLKDAQKVFDSAFRSFDLGISDVARAAASAIPDIGNVTDEQLKALRDGAGDKLDEVDQKLIENLKNAGKEIFKIQEEINANAKQQELQAARIRLTKVEEEKKTNKDLENLLQSRANIIKEFTAKFASIKDPFPDFFAKNLPLGKVEDKALRAALDNAFKVMSTAFNDVLHHKINVGDVPVEIKFKPEIVGKTDLVRQIEDKFGEIKGAIEDGVNKGIIDVPIDFKLPAEGDGQALKIAEDLVNNLAKSIESFSGQKKAILNFDFDVKKLNPATFEKVMDDAQKLATQFASGTPLVFSVTADLKVTAKLDKEKLKKDFNQAVSNAVSDFVNNTLSDIGESIGQGIGDALSGNGIQDAFKGLLKTISENLAQLGKALIKAGIIGSGIAKAVAALGRGNPALAIAAGIALIALSRALQNSLSNGGARERGGPVQKGFAYTVNERGREAFLSNSGKMSMIEGGIQTFRPSESGKIIPASLAKAVFQKFNLPKFESGGLITGPTFGLLGEGAGISRFNPEVIAPLNTLKGLLGFGGDNNINLNLAMQTRGKDLKLIGNRTDRSQRRTT